MTKPYSPVFEAAPACGSVSYKLITFRQCYTESWCGTYIVANKFAALFNRARPEQFVGGLHRSNVRAASQATLTVDVIGAPDSVTPLVGSCLQSALLPNLNNAHMKQCAKRGLSSP